MKPDYAFKSAIMKNYSVLLEVDNSYKKASWRLYNFEKNGVVPYDCNNIKKDIYNRFHNAYNAYENYFSRFPIELKEASKINRATVARSTRLNSRIRQMLFNNDCEHLFLTLTFTDNVLEHTASETRRRYVTRFLSENCIYYVANVDYGAKYGREHYHAVVNSLDLIDHKKWVYGAIKFERIRDNNYRALAKYVNKLTNHAIKETTKRSAIIYSNSFSKCLK